MSAEKKRISLTINATNVEVESPSSVFQAAEKAGIFIPHYCYHPDLSVAGVCRMCLVEIHKFPKLQVSCNTPAVGGMVIQTDTPKVRLAVKGVLELHLINHPLDCPICDKAGECKLQDFYADYGLYQSRMEFEKVHKPKVVDIGRIVLDSERCILCTRCVRFTDEVTKTNELVIFNRGDRSELKTYDGGPLGNEYTGNLVDVCPVGALTAKDFRFQCRVWFLEKTKSICTLCARGCNTVVSVNPTTKNLYRIEPRRNPAVNKSWICDTGRWGYHYVTSENRLKTPLLNSAGGWVESHWHAAFQSLHEEISPRTLVALSPQLTNEEIADCVSTFGTLGVSDFTWIVDEAIVGEREPWDGILRHRDSTPNAAGFKFVMGFFKAPWLGFAEIRKGANEDRWNLVLMLGLEGEMISHVGKFLSLFPKGMPMVVHATNRLPHFEDCRWLLPNTSSFEKSGTMINALGRFQKLQASLPKQFISRDAHDVIFGISRGHDKETAGTRALEIFETTIVKALGKTIRWREIDPLGVEVSG